MPVLTFVLFLRNCAILTNSSMCWKNSVTFPHTDLRLSQTMYHVRVVVFWVTCKGKLKSVWVIAVDTNSSVSQSDFKCNTCNRSKTRERPSFRFAFDWLINWLAIFSLCNHLAVQNECNFETTHDTREKKTLWCLGLSKRFTQTTFLSNICDWNAKRGPQMSALAVYFTDFLVI